MTDREKLVELLKGIGMLENGDALSTAKYLIPNGVTVRETTSEDFLAKVKDLERKHYPDFETMHSVLDLAMEELLIELGYEAAVDFIREQDRWYS